VLAFLEDLSAEQRADVLTGTARRSIEYGRRRVILVSESATLEPIVVDTTDLGLRLEPSEGPWRVAAQIGDGFVHLNDNAVTLFGAPTEGLRT
jgi:hypothetical protein